MIGRVMIESARYETVIFPSRQRVIRHLTFHRWHPARSTQAYQINIALM